MKIFAFLTVPFLLASHLFLNPEITVLMARIVANPSDMNLVQILIDAVPEDVLSSEEKRRMDPQAISQAYNTILMRLDPYNQLRYLIQK